MNILLTTFFTDNGGSLTVFVDHFGHWLVDCLNKKNISVKFLMYERLYQENQTMHQLDYLHPILFSAHDIQEVFGNQGMDGSALYQHLHHAPIPIEEQQKLTVCLQKKLGDWIPDVVIAQGSHSVRNIMKHIYPRALCLTQENAIFSRPPFCRTLFYDPFNSVPNNFLVKYAGEINRCQITRKQNVQIEKLKKTVRHLIHEDKTLKCEIRAYKKKFKKLVLLPLVGRQGIELFKDSICKSELELVEYVMQHVPKSIGVFVTQSDLFASLTPEDISYFSNKYPNFIFLKRSDVRGFANNSLNYFGDIDAILNVTSKTGFMALLWDIPVLSLAKTYNNWYQDSQDIRELPNLLCKSPRNKNHLLYWYLTRYVLFVQDFQKKDFLWKFLSNKLDYFRKNGIDFGFFEEINSIKKITNYLAESIIKYNTVHYVKDKINFTKNLAALMLHNPPLTFYTTSRGINIKLFGFIKIRIWPKMK